MVLAAAGRADSKLAPQDKQNRRELLTVEHVLCVGMSSPRRCLD